MAVLSSLLTNRLISRFGEVLWPNFHVSTCLSGPLKTLTELIEITRINKDLLEKVEANFRKRLQQCINENGHQILMSFSTKNFKWLKALGPYAPFCKFLPQVFPTIELYVLHFSFSNAYACISQISSTRFSIFYFRVPKIWYLKNFVDKIKCENTAAAET